ncbi:MULTISPECIES: GNAT family N-acetyltransferase [unclassified Pseudomonas]|uniref:GNAT family N-acetyltransferase n=1 Tax=unclassified Pseudomonas TaxID=196821 RepID=UPI001B3319AB|nr:MULTISPECIES: GNAT family N-acetyltransferase [unclassified Pseudomonas]MBP5943239.1 GNAT family N-acetyltransferase [Pseudomonas sp. P9(2020)]MBZ9562155.1 GNAT family N-acetyltransferase [Pseudomonas sp. P116]
MNFTHRPVLAEDVKTVCSFPQGIQELFFMFPKANYPLTQEQLHSAISQRFDSTVFEDDGVVVGFANFYRAEHNGICCIGNVIVAPSARGRGVARYIIETMTALGFEKYLANEVQLSCFNENTTGLLLYPKLGFTPFAIEERPAPDGGRTALIQMTRHKS